MNKIIILITSLFIVFTSCNDWTETKSLNLIEADIEIDNPELYQLYLANLREYREREHKYTYVWFDNIAGIPNSLGQRINTIPDSVDVVNLVNPDELSPYVIEDMEKVKRDKGMKFVLTISYLALEREYEEYITQINTDDEGEGESDEETTDPFLNFAENYVDRYLELVEKYDYDGISVLFYGMITSHLPDSNKEQYLARENVFMSKIETWVNANTGKIFIFEGYPQNLTDKTVLQNSKFIVVHTEQLTYVSALEFEVLLTIAEGVPIDRFMITVSARDFTDEKVGNYINENNEMVSALPIAAEWVDSYNPRFSKIGLGIVNAQNDYYNSGNNYLNIRTAINIMNP